MRRKKYFNCSSIFILISFIAWALSCAVNPVTGKKEFMLLTESDEVQMGKQTDGQVMEMYLSLIHI